ncbi:S8 family serine peptidase [Micromonospora sp. NPDC093277]|uniref:S8 family serine peptidase n=1 Tax=Micromonospora sp. NPDC093277 TaxID=3364291 RepID=UPI00382ACC04
MTVDVRGWVALALCLALGAGPLVAAAEPARAEPAGQTPAGEFVKYYVVGSTHQDRPENLDEIAGWFLGAPGRATDIRHLNAGRRQPDGAALGNDQTLRPGWLLVLPWDAVGDGVRYGVLPSPAPLSPASAGPQPVTSVRTEAVPPAGGEPAQPSRSAAPPRDGCSTTQPARPRSDWARRRLAVDQAWERSQGEGVLAAVVDSGVDGGLAELAGRVTPGADIPAGTGHGDIDCLGSGTAMASILAARSRTDGSGPVADGEVAGMAPAATVLPIRVVAGVPSSTPADGAVAIEVAVSAGARVVALGSYVDVTDPAVARALVQAREHDVLVVAAAVSEPSSDVSPRPAPPASTGVLWVGGVGPEGQPVDQYRPGQVDVVAPGIDVPSLGAGDPAVRSSSGSQYAVAAVAGLAVLIRSAFPHLDAAQVRHRIEATADGAAGPPDPVRGHGMINPRAAVTLQLAEESEAAPASGSAAPHLSRLVAVLLTVLLVVAALAVVIRHTGWRNGSARAAKVPSLAVRIASFPRWVTAAAGLALVALLGVVTTAGFGTAIAGNRELVGRPVPTDQLPAVQAAALSCPALTPDRLAGQVMAASGFGADVRSATGGTGTAGLTAEQWERWKPAATARRADPKANIVALAHAMCDLVGQVRRAGVGGDPWRLALGAFQSGVAEVRTARGVPAAATGYVDTVARLAAWYAGRPEFAVASPSSPPTGSAAVSAAPAPVPDDYLPLVLSAGRACAAMPPARIAAQLMAASAFNANRLGTGGAQGIAGFTPQVWTSYAPHPATTSPWDPAAAIPAVGRTMCALTSELSGLAADPYPLAVAAFVWGPGAVKQAGGVPASAGLRTHVDLVRRYAEYYARDPRLGGRPAVAAPVAGPTAGRPPSGPRQSAAPPRTTPKRATGTDTAGTGTAKPRTAATRARPAPAPKPNWQTRVVHGTAVLTRGQAWSTNRLRLTLRTDGEVALIDQGRTVWRAGTAGKGGAKLVFQGDGNLALYNGAGSWVWSTSTEGHDGAILVLQADGNVTISINGRSLWHTGTQD